MDSYHHGHHHAVDTHPGLTPFTVTKPAAEKMAALNPGGYAVRVAVSPGGCSGLRYQLYFDHPGEDDTVIEAGDTQVVIDKASWPYLQTATVDYHDTLAKQGFSIDNPTASGSCACGDSFY